MPATGNGSGASTGVPVRTASSNAQHSTVRASGPTVSSVVESGTAPARDTRFAVGFKPTMPLRAAGMRHEPPVSVPRLTAVMSSAIATAAPLDEPPGMRPVARSNTLSGVP